MLVCITILFLMMIGPSCAVNLIIKDGDTLTLDGTDFRLDGIDAPEKDQMCFDEKGEIWACGIEARDQLAALIGNRVVRCEDMGPDNVYPKRRIGICTAEGETISLNRWLVREGWALNFEPYAKGRFKLDENDARENRRGLWGLLCSTVGPPQLEKERGQVARPHLRQCSQTRAAIYSLIIPTCRPVARLKGKSPCEHTLQVIAAFTTWRAAAAIPTRRIQTAGSAPKTRRRLRDSANRTDVRRAILVERYGRKRHRLGHRNGS
jgi:endonuclease YncB( thermonuclease family)